ncbi:MAG TPA: GNAT family N-acetyltransferase [Streptosporangiaceae bacterium]
MTAAFIPGIQLAREFYAEAVRPLLDRQAVPYAAALLGPGSEVAGFDTERSTDHDWGPRLLVLLSDADAGQAETITGMLANSLPGSFGGYPVAFPVTSEPGGAARHRVRVTGLGAWLAGTLGFDPRRGVTVPDWLATPAQRLAEVTSGEVFHDAPGELTRIRDALAWYPHDLWLHVLACQWRRIAQEEAFPGRCAEAGDHLGSAVVTARLTRDLMRLCLLMHRRYPPYSKWLGTAFARLPRIEGIKAALTGALAGQDWRTREQNLRDAYEAIAALHNQLGVTQPVDTHVRSYYDRPYLVIGADRFTTALRQARLPLTGAVDQFIDSTDAAGDLDLLRACTRAAIRGPVTVLIRRESAGDADGIRAITAAAFGRSAEATLIEELRASDAWLPALSLVAVNGSGELAGHVLCTRGYAGDSPALGLGPLGVRPDSQRGGVGSALMNAVLGAADALGEPLVALLGDPAYYRRFGFRPSSEYEIVPPEPRWQPHFQVRTLSSYAAERGAFRYAEPFTRV